MCLVRHLRDGTKLAELPADLRPRDRRDGYRIQSRLETISAAPLFGWKIAATNPGGQATLGVDGPLAGRLLQEFVQADGGAIPLGANVMRIAEAEFAFRMARDLAPRAEPYSAAEVLEAVGELLLAIEVPDCRFLPVAAAGVAQLIADNSCCGLFVMSEPVAADWRSRDLGEVGVAHAHQRRRSGGRQGRRRARRAFEGTGLACQRTLGERRDAEGRRDRFDGKRDQAAGGGGGRQG